MKNGKTYQRRKAIIGVISVLAGIVLLVSHFLTGTDDYWSGMGTGLLAAGAVLLIRSFRYDRDQDYRELVDMEQADERNRFLATKAWAWAGYLFLMAAAAASIIAMLAGQSAYAVAASGCICLLLVFYIASYFILRRKY